MCTKNIKTDTFMFVSKLSVNSVNITNDSQIGLFQKFCFFLLKKIKKYNVHNYKLQFYLGSKNFNSRQAINFP